MIAEGTYQNGEVLSAKIDDSGYQNALVAVFECAVTDNDGTNHSVACKHQLEGEYDYITKAVFELVGLSWPDGVRDMSPAVGKRVPIKIKHKPGKKGGMFVNAYIAASTTKPGTPAGDAALEGFIARAKASANDDEDRPIPF